MSVVESFIPFKTKVVYMGKLGTLLKRNTGVYLSRLNIVT